MRQLSLAPTSHPLVPMHATRSREIPLVCIPGAGASVTAFVEFVGELGNRWPTYGLQPRGIDSGERPHDSVEAAADYNLGALDELNSHGAIHLVGHSHGGLVAFELARRLREQGRPVASLTLIDSEPPEMATATAHLLGESHIRREFVDGLESTYARSLDIDDTLIVAADIGLVVHDLHAALVKAKCWSSRTTPDMLRGPLATYTAARRSKYSPTVRHAGRVNLVLVQEQCLREPEPWKGRDVYVDGWSHHIADLDVWCGPGNHFSILQPPHVCSVAKWWRRAREAQMF